MSLRKSFKKIVGGAARIAAAYYTGGASEVMLAKAKGKESPPLEALQMLTGQAPNPGLMAMSQNFFPEVFAGAAGGAVAGIPGGPWGVAGGAIAGGGIAAAERIYEGDYPFDSSDDEYVDDEYVDDGEYYEEEY